MQVGHISSCLEENYSCAELTTVKSTSPFHFSSEEAGHEFINATLKRFVTAQCHMGARFMNELVANGTLRASIQMTQEARATETVQAFHYCSGIHQITPTYTTYQVLIQIQKTHFGYFVHARLMSYRQLQKSFKYLPSTFLET